MSLDNLPLEVAREIFSYLVAEDRRSVVQTSAQLRKTLSSTFWETIIVDFRDVSSLAFASYITARKTHSDKKIPWKYHRRYKFPIVVSKIFFKPNHHSWFLSNDVVNVILFDYSGGWRRLFTKTNYARLQSIVSKYPFSFGDFTSPIPILQSSSHKSLINFCQNEKFPGVLTVNAIYDNKNLFYKFYKTLEYTLKNLNIQFGESQVDLKIPSDLNFHNLESITIELTNEYKTSLKPLLKQYKKWPKLKALELILSIDATFGLLETSDPYSPVCFILPSHVDTLVALPPNLETCTLGVIILSNPVDSSYVFLNEISPISLPQVTLLSVRDYEDFQGFTKLRSWLSCPNASLNLSCTAGGTNGDRFEIQKLSPVLSETINVLSLQIYVGYSTELISYLPNFTNLSRIQLTPQAQSFEKTILIPNLYSDGSCAENKSFFKVNELYDLVFEYCQYARYQFSKSPVFPDQKNIIDNMALEKEISHPDLDKIVGALRSLLSNPLEYIQSLGQLDLVTIGDELMDTLLSIGVNESIFKTISEMPSVKFLEIEISNNFYISPYLQHLSHYHPALEQILFSYSEARDYQLDEYIPFDHFDKIIAQSSPAMTQFPLSQREVEKFFYTLLPEVPYKFILELSVLISQNTETLDFEENNFKQVVFIYRQGDLSSVIDVKRKRCFEHTPYQQQFSPTHYTPFKKIRQQKPIKPSKDIILEPSFNGWI
ncbi:uncharacterized protein SAPINGB_P005764 [Magnusiomyces paraingens]|uniref:F-box domain-containing protein n=1 Tax=Magnusiomyces paraingens TaxID=2606893 RepID=A0A5E8C3N2_9ASCO|nr:uncharacterized protein SAPINGB_P005764 [Saprochaete ingens]VVT57575.1 unnamed protein product [Saprochaete ingens]